jgi:hypothetical protein
MELDRAEVELQATFIHNRDDEMEHAAMLIEWVRWNIPEFAERLTKFLEVEGSIT